MAWVTKAALSSLADVSAAALVSQPTQTRAAVDARVQPVAAAAAVAAVADSQTVKDAAAAAVASEVAAGAIHAPALLASGSANDAAAGLHRVDNPASVSNLPPGAGPGLLSREGLRDLYVENGTPALTFMRRMQGAGLAGWEVAKRERVIPHALTRPLAASTDTATSRSVRIPFQVPVTARRWRVVIRNANYRTNTTYPGSVTLNTLCIGTGSRDSTGALSSSFKPSDQFASGLAIIVRGATADLGVGYSSAWQTSRDLRAGTDYLLSFGYTHSGVTVQNSVGGGWRTTGKPMNAELVNDATAARVNRLPFDVRIEYIDDAGVPQDVMIGDSISQGSDASFAVSEAPINLASRLTGRAVRLHGFGGAAFGEWIGANWGDPASLKWQEVTQYGPADRVFIALGNNDIHAGTTLTVLKANFEALVALVKERVSGTVIACTVTPRTAWAGTQENLRKSFNEYLMTFPAGIAGVADTASAVSDAAGHAPSDLFVVGDGIHFNSSGSAALASTLTVPSEPVSVVDRLAALEQDTGVRDVTALATGMSSGTIKVLRSGKNVNVQLENIVLTNAGTQILLQLPLGFRPTFEQRADTTPYFVAESAPVVLRLTTSGNLQFHSSAGNTGGYFANFNFLTGDTFPTTLPGNPA